MAMVSDPAEKLKVYEKCMNDDYIAKMQGNRNTYKQLKPKQVILRSVNEIVHPENDKSIDKDDLDKELLENQDQSFNTSTSDYFKSVKLHNKTVEKSASKIEESFVSEKD